jgi:hypothetical protein
VYEGKGGKLLEKCCMMDVGFVLSRWAQIAMPTLLITESGPTVCDETPKTTRCGQRVSTVQRGDPSEGTCVVDEEL